METLSFQAPAEMKSRLDEFARKFDRSKGYIIRQALEEYLDDMQDYIEAAEYKSSYDGSSNVSLAALKSKYRLK